VHVRHLFRTTLGALALVAAGACNDETGPGFDDSFLEHQGEEAAEWAYGDLYSLVQRLNFGSPSSGVSVKVAELRLAAEGCAVEASGVEEDPWDPVDANDNGIADDYTVRYTCVETDTASDGTLWTERFESRMRVKERAGALHGYDVEQVYRELDEGSNGDRYEESHKFVERLVITAGAANASTAYHGTWSGRTGGVPWAESWGSEQEASFDPSGPIVAGEKLPDGELLLDGRLHFSFEDEPAVSFTLSGAGPLQYSASCAAEEHQPFIGGTFGGAFGGDGAKGFRFTFSDCGVDPLFEVFGHDTPEE
jgi:hypothetical protein